MPRLSRSHSFGVMPINPEGQSIRQREQVAMIDSLARHILMLANSMPYRRARLVATTGTDRAGLLKLSCGYQNNPGSDRAGINWKAQACNGLISGRASGGGVFAGERRRAIAKDNTPKPNPIVRQNSEVKRLKASIAASSALFANVIAPS